MCSSRPRQLAWRADAHIGHVGHESGDVWSGQLVERAAGGLQVADDPIVDIGDVHHPRHSVARPFEVAAGQVAEQERAEVAHMGRAVDGRPARVHAYMPGLEWCEIFDLPAEGIGQAQRHAPMFVFMRRASSPNNRHQCGSPDHTACALVAGVGCRWTPRPIPKRTPSRRFGQPTPSSRQAVGHRAAAWHRRLTAAPDLPASPPALPDQLLRQPAVRWRRPWWTDHSVGRGGPGRRDRRPRVLRSPAHAARRRHRSGRRAEAHRVRAGHRVISPSPGPNG